MASATVSSEVAAESGTTPIDEDDRSGARTYCRYCPPESVSEALSVRSTVAARRGARMRTTIGNVAPERMSELVRAGLPRDQAKRIVAFRKAARGFHARDDVYRELHAKGRSELIGKLAPLGFREIDEHGNDDPNPLGPLCVSPRGTHRNEYQRYDEGK